LKNFLKKTDHLFAVGERKEKIKGCTGILEPGPWNPKPGTLKIPFTHSIPGVIFY
jgi:hypothetical protein